MTADPQLEADPAAEDDDLSGPGLIARVLSFPRRITAAGWAAIVAAVFLVLLVAAAWTLLVLDPNIPIHTLTWTRIAIVIVLLIAIPVVLYYAVRLWMEGDAARHPDIDFAWNAGLRSLSRGGISLRRTPLFVFLGANDSRHERAIVRAAGLNLRVRGEPDGPAPLHWYANPQGVYLFLTEVGMLSELATVMAKREAEMLADDATQTAPMLSAPAAPPPTIAAPAANPAPQQPAAPARAHPAPNASDSGRGTVSLDEYLNPVQQAAPAASQAATPPTAAGRPGSGTVTLDQPVRRETPPPQRSIGMNVGGPAEDQPALVAPQRAAEQIERLDYICRLLRRVRDPMCAANGVVTLLPFHAIQAGVREAHELEKAVHTDLTTMQGSLQLRCPVTALVDGMERERGFRELVERVGPQRAAVQRFGRRYDVRNVATSADLTALCEHVCGVFEDWIYTLFREKDALHRAGNTQLYGLLCTIRSRLKGWLGEILARGFGHDPRQNPGAEPHLFSGCYFAATGDTPDGQAFVKGVFDKLVEEQENVEWTARARVLNRRYRLFALVGAAAAVVTSGTLAFLVAWRAM